MEEKKISSKTGGRGLTDYFKRAISYTYPQVVSAYVSLPSTQTEPEKVTNMVGTFLNKDSNGLWIIRVPATQTGSEKVASTVATFLNEGNDGFQKIRITTTQTEPEKVTNMVETFLNEGNDGLRTISVKKSLMKY